MELFKMYCNICADLYQICEGRAHDRLKVKDTGALLTETDSVAGMFLSLCTFFFIFCVTYVCYHFN